MCLRFAILDSQEHNETVPTETSEFAFLDAQAASLGVDVPPVTRVSLTLNDGRTLSALRFGAGEPVATFLHGAGLNSHTWDATVLSLGLPALAIDLAGHGDSSWREDLNYSPATLAGDIAEALNHWTKHPQIVVGQSLGGLTAATLAAQHPQLVRELIIIDITPGIDTSQGPAALREFFAGPTDFASRSELVDRALAFGLGGTRADTERGVFLNTRVRPDGRVEWKHHLAHLAAHAFANATPTAPDAPTAPRLLDTSGWDDLARVTCPITLVRALRGFVNADDVTEFIEQVPQATVAAIDAPHNAQETAFAELAALVRARHHPHGAQH